jgi:hypothetical protein
LGTGTGKPHQAFSVAQPYLVLDRQEPFAIVPEVRVDGDLWTFKPNLLDSGNTDIHFTVESYFNAIRFGDGVLGKLLPEGAEVTISYRSTRGARGNLPESTVFAPDTRSSRLSPVLREAINSAITLLIIAEGGASDGTDPTSLDEARQQAISALKTRWRAVSADDFEQLLLGLPEGTVLALDTRSSDLSSFVIVQKDTEGGVDTTSPEEARQQAISALKTRWRAVSADDFEQLVLGEKELPKIARARCLVERDLTASDPNEDRPGHVSVIVVPDDKTSTKPVPSREQICRVYDFLDKRRLVTCRHHVVGPSYTDICIATDVVRLSQVPSSEVVTNITTNLEEFFGIFEGGPEADEEGWPFGRDVYASEVYQVIEGTEGVDHVELLMLYIGDETAGDWVKAGDKVDVAANSLVHFVAKSKDESYPGKITARVEQ